MKKAVYAILLLLVLGGTYLLGAWSTQRAASPNSPGVARKILYYVDPMHPAYKSDRPGVAPDCGMELVPVYEDGTWGGAGASTTGMPPGTVNVSPEKQQLIGVKVGQVEKTSGTSTLRTLGRVALDETRVFRVTVPVDGLVRDAGPIVTGNIVQKDQVLATFYNRDFLTAQQTYLYGLNTMDRFKDNESAEQLKLTGAQIRAAEENLEFLGMGKTQLQEIARTRQIARNIELRSSVAGLVLARNVFPGLRFDRGTELYRIGDISHVWILADIFEGEARYFRPGVSARVIVPQLGKAFQATASNVVTQFDPNSRTLKVRLEMDNPDYTLRPDMFVDVELPITLPPAIAVSVDAVVDAGVKKTVFVDRGEGIFEPREVETGWRYWDRVEILKGLMPGERIVVSGTFLLDSESRMKAAAAGATGHMHEGHTHPAEAAATGASAVARAFATAIDPICVMKVDIEKAAAAGLTVKYQGKNYYFCTDDCKETFGKDPKRYAAAAKTSGRTP